MTRAAFVLRLTLIGLLGCASLPVLAQEMPGRPMDDRVMFDLSAEDWVTTKSAHVTVNVEAAVSGNNAGSVREDMMKAVNDLAKGDWRLTSFNRSMDQTGFEHWSISFESRLPEAELNGLADNAKKLSKTGLQLTVTDIDFSPTLAEMEAARATVRMEIYKEANAQLSTLNAAMPGRNYRLALVNFAGDETEPNGPVAMPHVMRGPAAMSLMMKAASSDASPAPVAPPMERSEKVSLTARVVFASMPPAPGVHPTPQVPQAPAPQMPPQAPQPAPQPQAPQAVPAQPVVKP